MAKSTGGARVQDERGAGAKGLGMRAAALVLIGAVVVVGVAGYFVLSALGHSSTSTSSSTSCTGTTESYCTNNADGSDVTPVVALAAAVR
ncbi:MAG TPA: hypothetical protein VMG14_04985 [Thermoplasmata archaeon]|nr:hypothetical protein [Thermoplasmata archaeon]